MGKLSASANTASGFKMRKFFSLIWIVVWTDSICKSYKHSQLVSESTLNEKYSEIWNHFWKQEKKDLSRQASMAILFLRKPELDWLALTWEKLWSIYNRIIFPRRPISVNISDPAKIHYYCELQRKQKDNRCKNINFSRLVVVWCNITVLVQSHALSGNEITYEDCMSYRNAMISAKKSSQRLWMEPFKCQSISLKYIC